jgi:hypothetical protein
MLAPALKSPIQLSVSDLTKDRGPQGDAPLDVALLKEELRLAIESVQLPGGAADEKTAVRQSHARQRGDVWRREFAAVGASLRDLTQDFARGSEVNPERIQPSLFPVARGTRDADLFRLATLLWSVPVSRGYGRRMRFLVRDDQNGKIIGLFALGDPVFNLRARDQFVGWNAQDRRERLANVMDAFVVGAVPPYSRLLGGKLVFSLIGSHEVGEQFGRRYRNSTGIISGAVRSPELTLVTVTSALGRSSLYNRLRLRDPDDRHRYLLTLNSIGWTTGYGHFQVGDDLFMRLRQYLAWLGHPYADGHRFGMGPNWRMRVIRVALEELGLSSSLLRHGIERQVFALPLADNWREYLLGRDAAPILNRPSAATISAAAKLRWVVPRSKRDPSYAAFEVDELERLLLLGGTL